MRVIVIYPPDKTGEIERKFVVETTTNDLLPALNEAWRRFNNVNGTEECVKYKVRSLCVGDVLKAEGSLYLIMGVGYRKITGKNLAELKELSFAERAIKFMGKGDV